MATKILVAILSLILVTLAVIGIAALFFVWFMIQDDKERKSIRNNNQSSE